MPSFMLMDVQGMSLVLYIYTLDNGQIKVEKVAFLFLQSLASDRSFHIEKGSHKNVLYMMHTAVLFVQNLTCLIELNL